MVPATHQTLSVEVEPGIRLAVEAEAENGRPAVLFSHSIGASLAMWDEVVTRLDGRIRAIRYDTRGHGASSVSLGPLTIDRLGLDLVAILDELELERAVVCGLSLGGITGLWLAANRPDRVTGLVLANTAANFPPPSMWRERAAAVRAEGMAPLREATMQRWFSPAFQDQRPDRVAAIAEGFTSTPNEGFAACCDVLAAADLAPQLAAIRCPTLVICGSQDPSTPPARGRELVAGISGAGVMVVEAAHISAVEAAGDFAGAVDRFVSDLARAEGKKQQLGGGP